MLNPERNTRFERNENDLKNYLRKAGDKVFTYVLQHGELTPGAFNFPLIAKVWSNKRRRGYLDVPIINKGNNISDIDTVLKVFTQIRALDNREVALINRNIFKKLGANETEAIRKAFDAGRTDIDEFEKNKKELHLRGLPYIFIALGYKEGLTLDSTLFISSAKGLHPQVALDMVKRLAFDRLDHIRN